MVQGRRTRDRKDAGSRPCSSGEKFSTPGSTFYADFYFGIRYTPVLPQQHVNNPGHSAKSAGGSLQLNTHAPSLCGFAIK